MKHKTRAIVISSPEARTNMHYLCGTPPPEGSLLLQSGSNSTLFTSSMEYNRMCIQTKPGTKVVVPEQLGSSLRAGPAEWIQIWLQEKKQTTIVVAPDFPVGIFQTLEKSGIKIEIDRAPACPRREIKSTEEIKAIQKSQQAAVNAMKAAIQQISSAKPGPQNKLFIGKTPLTSEEVRRTILRTLLDLDCTAEETIVAGGPQSADPHQRGEGPLYAGQPIVLDIFPRSGKTGYWGDITRTVCRGPAPAALKKQYAAVKAAQVAQLKILKAGVFADTIHKTGAELMEARGYKTETVNRRPQGFIHGTGHGVGLEIHEAPRVSSAVRRKLRAGHIVTIEPGLYYPDIGGVRIEDTVLVAKEGYKMLAPCKKQLEI